MTSSPLDPSPDEAEDVGVIPEKTESPPTLDLLARRLEELQETMRREHERAAHRERVIDRLHAENQELRHGLVEEALTPVRAGLYRLYDTARREAARWGKEPPSPEHAAALLEAIAAELGEILGRAGAERIPVNAGDDYDPVIHRPVRTTVVGPEADGTVVEVLADGFAGVARGAGGAMRERVTRKAAVVVGRAPRAPNGSPGKPDGRSANRQDGAAANKAGDAVANKPGAAPAGRPSDASANKPDDASTGRPGDASADSPGDVPADRPGDASANEPAGGSMSGPDGGVEGETGDGPASGSSDGTAEAVRTVAVTTSSETATGRRHEEGDR